jgi:hypothetical protein
MFLPGSFKYLSDSIAGTLKAQRNAPVANPLVMKPEDFFAFGHD